jgi:hypothetical protein
LFRSPLSVGVVRADPFNVVRSIIIMIESYMDLVSFVRGPNNKKAGMVEFLRCGWPVGYALVF